MKAYVHARLREADRIVLERLKKTSGHSESEIIRQGLQLVARATTRQRSALQLAGRSVGRFQNGPGDLSANKKHLEGFGA